MSKDSARCVGPRGPSPRGQVLLLCPSTSFENNACKVLPSSDEFRFWGKFNTQKVTSTLWCFNIAVREI